MSQRIGIEVTDTATPFLSRLTDELKDLKELHSYMAPQLEELTREYLRDIAGSRHATANRLGAAPTNHLLRRGADAVESGFDSTQVYVSLPRDSGLGRAFRDFDITPKNGKKWLTRPVHARSYGKRAREFNDLIFIPFDSERAGLFAKGQNGKLLMLYALRKRMHIKQDRTLLPSDQQFAEAAELGAREYIKDIKDITA